MTYPCQHWEFTLPLTLEVIYDLSILISNIILESIKQIQIEKTNK